MEDSTYHDVCYAATSGEVPPPFDIETMDKLHIEAKRAEDLSRQRFEKEKRASRIQEKHMHQDCIHRIRHSANTKIKEQEEDLLSKSILGASWCFSTYGMFARVAD